MRNANPNAKRPILMIPVGHVLHELDQRMKAGQLPGYKGVIEDLNADGIHLNNKGSFVVASTFHATLWKQAPAGLPSSGNKVDDEAFVKLSHKVIWQVVQNHPLAGIAPEKP